MLLRGHMQVLRLDVIGSASQLCSVFSAMPLLQDVSLFVSSAASRAAVMQAFTLAPLCALRRLHLMRGGSRIGVAPPDGIPRLPITLTELVLEVCLGVCAMDHDVTVAAYPLIVVRKCLCERHLTHHPCAAVHHRMGLTFCRLFCAVPQQSCCHQH